VDLTNASLKRWVADRGRIAGTFLQAAHPDTILSPETLQKHHDSMIKRMRPST